jgi:hypothetical protein
MPGVLGTINGFIERQKGRGFVESSALQRFGKAGIAVAGGGNLPISLSVAGVGNGADVTEDTLFSLSLPANSFDIVGRELFLQAFGSIAATSATKNARVYFGSTVLVNFSATTTQTGTWCVTASVFKTGASAQVALIQTDTTISGSLVRAVSIATPTETDTAAIVIKVTGQSSVATANLVLCNGMIPAGYN